MGKNKKRTRTGVQSDDLSLRYASHSEKWVRCIRGSCWLRIAALPLIMLPMLSLTNF